MQEAGQEKEEEEQGRKGQGRKWGIQKEYVSQLPRYIDSSNTIFGFTEPGAGKNKTEC